MFGGNLCPFEHALRGFSIFQITVNLEHLLYFEIITFFNKKKKKKTRDVMSIMCGEIIFHHTLLYIYIYIFFL